MCTCLSLKAHRMSGPLQVLPMACFAHIKAASDAMWAQVQKYDDFMDEGPKKVALFAPYLENFRILAATAKRACEMR